ncbi:hypothetical protein RI129_007365 [Pyrocoelia pectoralis]|uniref:4-coumarate--CoA ligase n=1 Tax=Pyrocoelia pectoralis TaxID=417401 RepID=A0AAN7ZET8_9COLE
MKCLQKLTYLSYLISRKFSSEIIFSKIKRTEIPKVSLTDYVWKDLDKWDNKTALVCAESGRSYSYTDVYKKSNKIANFLTHLPGLKQDDIIAIILPNVPEFAIITLGIVQAGYKVTTINPFSTKGNSLTSFKSGRNEVMDCPSGAIKLNDVLENTFPARNYGHKWNDVMYLPYSSGTSGFPKCIELTTENIISCLYDYTIPEFQFLTATTDCNQEVLPTMLPLHHIYGIIVLIINLALGCKAVTISKFTQDIFLSTLKKQKPTFCYLVPPLLQVLANNPRFKSEDVIQMKNILVGAAPAGVNEVERLLEKTKGKVQILQGYGLSEASVVLLQTASVPGGVKSGGCGLSLPHFECKFEKSSDAEFQDDKSGVLFIRGPQVFKGYLNNPEATELVLDSEGWFNTGDVKGYQVAPAELENLLRSHPDVEDAAVIGQPHASFGEIPKAFIVPKRGNRVDLKNIEDYVANRVSKHKQLLGGISVIESIPKSASGKILRRLLKK